MLPIDRTAKSVLDTNLVNGKLSDAPTIKAADDVIYNTIDELYNFATGLVNRSVLSALGVINAKDYNASGSSQVTIGSIAAGSNIITLGAAIDFINGHGISIAGNKEVASLQITAPATVSSNVAVTLNGVTTNVPVSGGVAEAASLTINAPATVASNVIVTLNGVATNIAVLATDTAINVADKIRATSFTGWTTGGTVGTITVTFTANVVGVQTGETYSAGTTGAAGTMTTTTTGVNADTIIGVANKIRAATFAGWSTSGAADTVIFTSTTSGNRTDATYSAGTTGAAGTIITTIQGSADFTTSIISGAGTTTLTLVANAVNTVSGVAVEHDDTVAMQAVRDYLATFANPPTLIFPAGVYKYSTSPNWAIQNAKILNQGIVRFRYTGTGNAVILDGIGGPNSNVYNMKFGQFIIEAPSNALNGVYMKCVHHSEIDIKVRGCGATSAGMFLYYAVCNKIKLTVSNNEEGWYASARPNYGLRFGLLIAGQLPAYNIFENCTIEGTIEGATLADSLGNIFIGGTMEGCLDNGLNLTSTAGLNKFYGMDFEANTGNDIVCAGFENQFFGVDSTKIVDFQSTSIRNSIFGGSFKNIIFEAGSSYNLVSGARYNRQLFDGTTGTITDGGTYNRLVDNMDVKLNKIGNRPATGTSVTVGASPFTYQNTTGNDQRMLVYGGTVSTIQVVHGVSGDTLTGAAWSNQFLTLSPGDSIILTYSVLPTLRNYST